MRRRYRYIAVDFDGTLCKHSFPEIGEIQTHNELVIKFIRKHKVLGSKIILWTCRENTESRKYLDEAVEWCKENDIPIDYVNENQENPFLALGCKPRKVTADLYIDDLAINANDITFFIMD